LKIGLLKSGKVRKAILGYLFASPWIASLCIFTIFAIFKVVQYSFSDFQVFKPPEWNGADNYVTLFTKDPLFARSLWNTFYYTIFAVPLGIIVALALAMLLNQKVIFRPTFRAIFYVPSVVPAVASSVLWIWILNPNYGLINTFLALLSIKGPSWLNNPTWSKPSLILMSTWGVGGSMIIFLAGLQDVPRELYEASEIDGANIWHKFWHVTIPMITPTIFFSLVMGIIGSFQVFTQAFIMTQGGPSDSTLFYVLYLYDNAFRYFKMGYASAMALILFFIILFFTLIVVSTSGRWVYYAGKR
jgi:multiple sugar transport system permease protein